MGKEDLVIPKRVGRTPSRIVDGEAVVVQPAEGLVNVFNDVGSVIWELCDGVNTVGDIARVVRNKYDVSESVALEDTMEFLQDLRSKGMLTLDG